MRHQAPPRDPQWYRDAVIYQIHVKSFFDANDDGVGDFAGLLRKLDYVSALGVDTVWLLPFYPSPRRDDGYDIADYRSVHPEYGTLADVRRFVREAHARGIRVITELVINHTSDQHPWFQRARTARPGSAARNYYVWSDTDDRYRGTRVIFCDTEPSNWTWDPVARAYFWHRFYPHQPDLNFDEPRVLAEVLGAMRFWLDAGVDGFRLDAVPYLIEREGTSSENLPETHAVLRLLRAKLDQGHQGRMLLAEANQWPEDTRPYFGQGDQCHMAFHFPLMPRMYMAIAQEDRFPVTDILRQTPDLPEGCQWAIFLRNHDELTLEMVTDRERDYLWSTYAADQRARLNLGIRRRLAPLLQNDRRRIELMNGLLLSMPGTPVIYYGDEIGMGDNLYLRDRDGVRTPMQWSPDRNGGFSRADPASLVLPPIQDPLYGYQAVNVESQSADPHSLLNWTRRMLAVRRRTRAFGRGAMRMLYPANRRVLAYVREHAGDLILCVFNLARTAQAVELDLAALVGRVPVEMLGGTAFPRVGTQPYLLTLPPYGFYWFVLATEQALPPWHELPVAPAPDLPTIVLRDGPSGVWDDAARLQIARDALPEYLPRRRWFAAAAEPPRAIVLHGATALPGTGNAIVLAECTVEHAGGTTRYALPLARVEEAEPAGAQVAALALARARIGRQVGWLTDACADDRFARAVLAGLRDGAVLPGAEGEIRFRATPSLPVLPEDSAIRLLPEQASNSAVVVGDRVVLKLLRRVVPGLHPEAEMGRHLTDTGFTAMPPLLGEVVRIDPAGTPHTLLLAQGHVPNQGDGWAWTLAWLARALDEAGGDAAPADASAGYLPFAAAMGRRLAELHAVLARPSDDPAFAPVPATAADGAGWAAGITADLDAALALLAGPLPEAGRAAAEALRGQTEALRGQADALRGQAEALRGQADALRAAVRRLAEAAPGALRTRAHGDLHLAQVLVAQGDAVFVDFEGEPSRPLDERRAKTSPLRDLAGLLRSLDYAARVAGATAAAAAMPTEQRAALLAGWHAAARAAVLEAYLETAAAAPHPWATPAQTAALVPLFEIGKAAYEIGYEAAHRPALIGVPVAGLVALAARAAS